MPEPLQKILAEAKGGKFSSITGLSEDGKNIDPFYMIQASLKCNGRKKKKKKTLHNLTIRLPSFISCMIHFSPLLYFTSKQ